MDGSFYIDNSSEDCSLDLVCPSREQIVVSSMVQEDSRAGRCIDLGLAAKASEYFRLRPRKQSVQPHPTSTLVRREGLITYTNLSRLLLPYFAC